MLTAFKVYVFSLGTSERISPSSAEYETSRSSLTLHIELIIPYIKQQKQDFLVEMAEVVLQNNTITIDCLGRRSGTIKHIEPIF